MNTGKQVHAELRDTYIYRIDADAWEQANRGVAPGKSNMAPRQRERKALPKEKPIQKFVTDQFKAARPVDDSASISPAQRERLEALFTGLARHLAPTMLSHSQAGGGSRHIAPVPKMHPGADARPAQNHPSHTFDVQLLPTADRNYKFTKRAFAQTRSSELFCAVDAQGDAYCVRVTSVMDKQQQNAALGAIELAQKTNALHGPYTGFLDLTGTHVYSVEKLMTGDVRYCYERLWALSARQPWSKSIAAYAIMGAALARLQTIQEKAVLHLDIKPDNLFFEVDINNRLWVDVVDFSQGLQGLGNTGQELARRAPYTPGFAAPERQAGQACDEKADIWSLAAVMVHLISGKDLVCQQDGKLYTYADFLSGNIDNRLFPYQYFSELEDGIKSDLQHPGLVQILGGMLDPNPSSRSSVEKCLYSLQGCKLNAGGQRFLRDAFSRIPRYCPDIQEGLHSTLEQGQSLLEKQSPTKQLSQTNLLQQNGTAECRAHMVAYMPPGKAIVGDYENARKVLNVYMANDAFLQCTPEGQYHLLSQVMTARAGSDPLAAEKEDVFLRTAMGINQDKLPTAAVMDWHDRHKALMQVGRNWQESTWKTAERLIAEAWNLENGQRFGCALSKRLQAHHVLVNGAHGPYHVETRKNAFALVRLYIECGMGKEALAQLVWLLDHNVSALEGSVLSSTTATPSIELMKSLALDPPPGGGINHKEWLALDKFVACERARSLDKSFAQERANAERHWEKFQALAQRTTV